MTVNTPAIPSAAPPSRSLRGGRRHERASVLLAAVRNNQLDLRNTDFDTGQPTHRGEYKLADQTYAELASRLKKVPGAPDGIRADIARFYGTQTPTN